MDVLKKQSCIFHSEFMNFKILILLILPHSNKGFLLEVMNSYGWKSDEDFEKLKKGAIREKENQGSAQDKEAITNMNYKEVI